MVVPARLARAVSRIDRARKELSRARVALARINGLEHPRVVSRGQWKQIGAAMESHAPRWQQREGVVGTGIGFRRVGGVESQEPCIIVAVEEKLSDRALRRAGRRAIPRKVGLPGGGSIGVDVVAVRGFRRLAFVGSSIGPSDVAEEGTLGGFARDRTSGRPVALTAMHVTGRNSAAPGSLSFVTPSLQDSKTPARLGAFLTGTKQGVDAAAIALAPGVPIQASIPGLGSIAGSRAMVFPGDRGIAVHFFGASSRFQSGTIVEPFVNLPQFGLQQAVLADIFAQPGDSGAGLVDNSRLLLGLLVGELFWEERKVKVFSPIRLVLKRLNCVIS